MTKNIQISFRLSPYQLAHGLEIIKGLEPTYKPSSLTAMVKLIVEDWIAKMSAATKPWPSDESIQAIKIIMQDTTAGRRAMAEQDNDRELRLIAQDLVRSGMVPSPQGLLDESNPSSERTSNIVKPDSQAMFAILAKFQTDKLNSQASIEVRQATEDQPTKSITKVVTDFSPPTMEELIGGTKE